MSRICIVPKLSGTGGMVSFQKKFVSGLSNLAIDVCFDLHASNIDGVLVVGGTKNIASLISVRKRGIPIFQRLNGMNWIHRKRQTGIRHFIRSEYGNWLLSLIRDRIATGIIYQSEFSQNWWERVYGPTNTPNTVILNGVNIDKFSPEGAHQRPGENFRILMVEGSLMGGYEIGLETAVELINKLNRKHQDALGRPVELMVVGRVADHLKKKWTKRVIGKVSWTGVLPIDEIAQIDRSAHLLFSADINAACPNSVIEALASGLPVLAFDTGALSELVRNQTGRIVPYGSDAWDLQPPDIDSLAAGAVELLLNQSTYRENARKLALEIFPVDLMVRSYADVILGSSAP